jgi:hypothetical protein
VHGRRCGELTAGSERATDERCCKPLGASATTFRAVRPRVGTGPSAAARQTASSFRPGACISLRSPLPKRCPRTGLYLDDHRDRVGEKTSGTSSNSDECSILPFDKRQPLNADEHRSSPFQTVNFCKSVTDKGNLSFFLSFFLFIAHLRHSSPSTLTVAIGYPLTGLLLILDLDRRHAVLDCRPSSAIVIRCARLCPIVNN